MLQTTMTERSPRAMNHMGPETKLVHLQLEEWGRWAKDPGISGYPTQSLTEKAAKYGMLGIPQESNMKPEPEMPEHVARVDAAVARLGDIDKRVIRLYYTHWEAPEVLSRRVHMRHRQFLNVVSRARWRVMCYLDAK